MKMCTKKRSKFISLLRAIILAICLIHASTKTPTTEASLLETGKNYIYDWVTADDSKLVTTLSIIEISDMRVRDIKRRLTREHGEFHYDSVISISILFQRYIDSYSLLAKGMERMKLQK